MDEVNSLLDGPIDARQLRAFALLAKTGNFTETAGKLYLSQSAVSHSIKALEEDLKCKLFDRGGRKAVLTPAGEQFLHYAERILDIMREAREALGKREDWGKPRLRLGAGLMACQAFLPPIMGEFRKTFENCILSVESGDTHHLIRRIEQNKIDLAISLKPGTTGTLEFHQLFEDELIFLCSPEHPWARHHGAPRESIGSQTLFVTNKSGYTFQLLEDYFRRESIFLRSVVELGSMEAIKNMVSEGLGVGIAAPWCAAQNISQGTLVGLPLGRRRLKRQWGLFHDAGRRLSLVEESFLGLCRHATKDFRGMFQTHASEGPSKLAG